VRNQAREAGTGGRQFPISSATRDDPAKFKTEEYLARKNPHHCHHPHHFQIGPLVTMVRMVTVFQTSTRTRIIFGRHNSFGPCSPGIRPRPRIPAISSRTCGLGQRERRGLEVVRVYQVQESAELLELLLAKAGWVARMESNCGLSKIEGVKRTSFPCGALAHQARDRRFESTSGRQLRLALPGSHSP